jgi:hypothetical protein
MDPSDKYHLEKHLKVDNSEINIIIKLAKEVVAEESLIQEMSKHTSK